MNAHHCHVRVPPGSGIRAQRVRCVLGSIRRLPDSLQELQRRRRSAVAPNASRNCQPSVARSRAINVCRTTVHVQHASSTRPRHTRRTRRSSGRVEVRTRVSSSGCASDPIAVHAHLPPRPNRAAVRCSCRRSGRGVQNPGRPRHRQLFALASRSHQRSRIELKNQKLTPRGAPRLARRGASGGKRLSLTRVWARVPSRSPSRPSDARRESGVPETARDG